MSSCNNICIKYKATNAIGHFKYANGQKRCRVCELFIIYDGIRCPCCKNILKTKPRSKKFKAKYEKSMEGERGEPYNQSIAELLD